MIIPVTLPRDDDAVMSDQSPNVQTKHKAGTNQKGATTVSLENEALPTGDACTMLFFVSTFIAVDSLKSRVVKI